MRRINWRYALGELVIVVIGISIAFALNNWWQSRQNRKLEGHYLENLRQDLLADIARLDSNVIALEAYMKTYREDVAPHLGPAIGERKADLQAFFRLAEVISFFPKDATYQTMVNSGDYHLIRDFELRRAIEAHYISYRELDLAYQRQRKIHERYLSDFFIHEIDFGKLRRQEDYSFMGKPLLTNIMQSLYGTWKIQRQASLDWRERCERLVNMIETAQGG